MSAIDRLQPAHVLEAGSVSAGGSAARPEYVRPQIIELSQANAVEICTASGCNAWHNLAERR